MKKKSKKIFDFLFRSKSMYLLLIDLILLELDKKCQVLGK